MDPLASLLNLWAHLRAAHHVYWTLHWQARGPSFYADHELFGELYEARVSEIDHVAELVAGHYGADKLDPLAAWTAAVPVVEAMLAGSSPVVVAQLVVAAAEAANTACAEAPAPASTQNVVADIGSAHLQALYLLQQRFGRAAQ